MNTRSLIAFGAGALAASSLAFLVASGPEHQDHKETDHGMMEMNPDDMMAAYMAMGQPGEHHEQLKKFVGSWDAKTSFAMDPTNPDQMTEGTGTCNIESVMDGRFIKSVFKSEFMGQPFTGYAYQGYDNGRDHHVSTWVDTMSTSITYMTGKENDNGQLEMTGMGFAPGAGEYKMRMVYKWHSDDKWSQAFYDQMPDGSWFNSGSITYTRQ